MASESLPSRQAPRWTVGLILALVLVAIVAFEWQRKTAQKLANENQQVSAVLQQTQAQLDALKAKIDVLTPPPAAAAQPKPAAAISHRQGKATVHAVRHRHPVDDPRWKQVQSRLDDQGKQIDATRQDLTSARTELSGSIARTHDELVVLERKGERSYFEFDVQKSKQFRATGPVGVRLRKANTKHSYADLELMVDDADLTKKHVNLLEPVVFYAAEGGRPVELVINSITKDHIHGYVATPKYKSTELAAMSGANGTSSTDGTTTQPPARRKLELPKD